MKEGSAMTGSLTLWLRAAPGVLRLRRRAMVAASLAIALVPAMGAVGPAAVAAGNTYYVNNAITCSDSGSGTTILPFCTIGKGAQVAQAGDTVDVVGGTYAGTAVNPTNSGASGSPITFTASGGVTISGGTDAFAISGRSYIVVNGFTVTLTTGAGISVSSSNNITISNNTVTSAGVRTSSTTTARGIQLSGTTSSLVTHNTSDNNSDHGIYLAAGSANNTVSFNEASLNAEGWQRNANGIGAIDTGTTGNVLIGNVVHDNEDSGLQFYTGANNGVAVDNVSYNNGDHGIDNLNVTGGVLTGNTVYHNCTSGINVEGTSGNYTIENNIAVDNAVYPAYMGISCSRRTGNIGIYDSAPTGTIADYNLVNLTTSGALYVWAGTAYSTIAALHTATSQEAHGLQADPKWVNPAGWNLHLTEGSPAIDSANSGAPSEPTTDADGNPRVDDPLTPNTGAGPRTYDDRGAYEYLGWVAGYNVSLTPTS